MNAPVARAGDVQALGRIREAHVPMTYDFPTEQTYCQSSDAPTDACHTCIALAEYDRLAARVQAARAEDAARLAAVEALHREGEARLCKHDLMLWPCPTIRARDHMHRTPDAAPEEES